MQMLEADSNKSGIWKAMRFLFVSRSLFISVVLLLDSSLKIPNYQEQLLFSS